MMKLIFNEDKHLTHVGRDNLTTNSLKGGNPVFLFLAKENFDTNEYDILHFHWGMSGRVRPMTEEDAFDKSRRYNPEWVLKNELSKETINDTTHLITGHYDLLKNEWHQDEIKIVGESLADDMLTAMAASLVKTSNVFYDDKELYLHNLKMSAESEHLAFLYHEDLQNNLNMSFFMKMMIDWFENEKEEVQKNTENDGEVVVVPILRIVNYLEENNVPKEDKDNNLNVRNLFGLMRAHDMFQSGYYDKKKETYYPEKDMRLMKREDIESRPEDFFEVPMFNERFLHIFS